MKVVLEISEKEIERLHELIGIPEETSLWRVWTRQTLSWLFTP